MAAARMVVLLLLVAFGELVAPVPMESMEAMEGLEGLEESKAALRRQHGRRRSLGVSQTAPRRLADHVRALSSPSSARAAVRPTRPTVALEPVRKTPPAASDSPAAPEDH
jgi:hypothetical protein